MPTRFLPSAPLRVSSLNAHLVLLALLSGATCSGQVMPADPRFRARSVAPEKPTPAPALQTRGAGVAVAGCPFFKNNRADDSRFTYRAVGALGPAPRFAVLEQERYHGSAYLLLPPGGCAPYQLRGYPMRHRNVIVCFNEERDTDAHDTLYVWRVTPSQKVVRTQTVPLAKAQTHARGRDRVWFSPDGRVVYFQSVRGQYFACKL
ncbi:hypothetical protein [Hymenobacter canadensis]|uniref:Biopolymer transporter Tol n=1 Tax=Hymenobacter canadensis TaxID=2999067 RepID=A0ABY7LVF4_9BACT|nr:hypothetical protein [Hymenobacter canadensis]WBA44359.1 hypothetical protein O3303_21370 [Hymenobacter canadensis]